MRQTGELSTRRKKNKPTLNEKKPANLFDDDKEDIVKEVPIANIVKEK